MIFTLEALQAGTGDSLILHYGDAKKPHFIVIDGGPAGIYKGSLKPRLQQLHDKFVDEDDDGAKLDLEMVMVSHIDDDHIHGVVDWMNDIAKEKAVPCNIATLWYNSFEDMTGSAAEEIRSKVASASVDPDAKPNENTITPLTSQVLLASVGQGRTLRAHAKARGIKLNGGFKGVGGGDGLVMALPKKPAVITRPGGLTLTVVGPSSQHLTDLLEEWKEDVAKNPDPVVVADFADKSVPNLSSIVVVAEFKGKKMLLTGDARGDFIREGLKIAGFLDKKGKAHFDLIKMPHHGSSRDMDLEWLQDLTADHYVISANGQFDNPDAETVEWMCQARGDDSYTIHMTNEKMVNAKKKNKADQDISGKIKKVFAKNPGKKRVVEFRKEKNLSVKAELLDPITY